MSSSIWGVLGIEAGSDRDTIRRAYARKLKLTNPEDDPEGFKTLRAAYEAALDSLRHAEWVAQWEETDWSDDAESDDPAPEDEAEYPVPHHSGAFVATDRPAAGPDLRTMEIAELQQRIDTLAHALNSPWGSQNDQLVEALEAVLNAPAMADIGIHADAEGVLAGMLANAIPRSDVLLPVVIAAFGWEEAAQTRNLPPAAIAILQRIEEWRLIAAIQDPNHGLNDAWRALTRAPASQWRMRLLALKPGLIGRVELLMSHAEHQAIGLNHSLDTHAVTWWQSFLARPHLTLGVLAAVPLGLGFALLTAWALAGESRALQLGVPIVLALIGLIWPAIHLRLMPLRQRLTHEAAYGRWRIALRCWLAVILLLPFGAMILPATPWAMLAALSAAFLLVLWPVLSAWEPNDNRPAVHLQWLAFQLFGIALLGSSALAAMPPAHLVILAAICSALFAVRIAFIRSAAAIVAAITPRFREAIILAVAIAAAFAAHAIGGAIHAQTPAYHGALAIAAILLLTAAAERADAQSPFVVFYWFVRIALGIAIIIIAADSAPDRPAPAPGTNVPAIDLRTHDERVDDSLGKLEARNPGFRSIRLRNPDLYKALRAAVADHEAGRTNGHETTGSIDRIIDRAFTTMLPDASNALLVEHFRLRQMRLQALREVAPKLCVDETQPVDPTLLPASHREHAQWLIYAVVSKSTYGSNQGGGKPIDMNAMMRIAAERLGISTGELTRRMERRNSDPKPACAAKMAVLGAIATQPVEDIAGFVRAGLAKE